MTITEFCGKIKYLADTLRDVGSPLLNQDLIMCLLGSLNEKFAHCISTISADLNLSKILSIQI